MAVGLNLIQRFIVLQSLAFCLLFSGVLHSSTVFLSQGLVSAEESVPAVPAPTTVSSSTPHEILQAKFYSVLQLVFQERYAEAGDAVRSLIEQGRDFGYRSFPEFSALLLKEAEKSVARNPELAAFFVRQAMVLSPNDLNVAISAFSFSEVLEKRSLWKYFRESIGPSLKRPRYLLPVLVNAVILLLSALTIAALIGCFVQLLRNGEVVFRSLTRFVPRNYRGVLGPVMVFAVLAGPLLFGLGVAIACWSVLLGRCLAHCRALPLLAALLMLAWTIVISRALPWKAMIDSPTARIVDEINNNGFSVAMEPTLRSALEATPTNPLLVFSLAKALVFEGRFDEGEELFRKADALADETGEISRSARLNLAVIAMREKDWGAARQFFEQDEASNNTRFEVLYNFALVQLAQLDIEQYRSYYTRAQEFDRKEWQRLDSEQGQQHLPVWSNLQAKGFLYAFFQYPFDKVAPNQPDLVAAQNKLSRSLVRGAGTQSLGIIGFLLLIATALGASKFSKPWGEQLHDVQLARAVFEESSLLWSILPGGVFLAGRRPASGVLFASLCFVVAFVMTGWPLQLMPVSQYPVSIQRHAFSCFLLAYGIGFIVPVSIEFFRRGPSEKGAPAK